MPDDLPHTISSGPVARDPSARPSYRIERQGRQLDAGTIRLLGFAGIALAVLVLGAGVWAWAGRAPSAVPVIEADARPVRVKPDNPGGMQVVGADEPDDGAPSLAPPPEAPAPLALRAQIQANRPPVAAVAAVGAVGVPAAPAPAPVEAAPPSAAAAARPSTPRGASGPPVQLAAVDSEEAARAEWGRLQRRFPDLLGGRQPSIQRADKDGRAIWRVRTGPFADIADATGFCAKLRAKGGGCSLGTF